MCLASASALQGLAEVHWHDVDTEVLTILKWLILSPLNTHVNPTLHTFPPRAFSIPPHPGSLVRRAIRRPHHRLRPTRTSTTSEALYNTVRPHWICQSSWALWNVWIRSQQSCCEQLWQHQIPWVLFSLLFPRPPLVLPCWFVLYSNGSCSPIAHHNTDSDHGAYALRPEPWQELLPSQSCFTYLTESSTSTDYRPPPSLREAHATWNSDRQIPLSKEGVFINLIQKLFQRIDGEYGMFNLHFSLPGWSRSKGSALFSTAHFFLSIFPCYYFNQSLIGKIFIYFNSLMQLLDSWDPWPSFDFIPCWLHWWPQCQLSKVVFWGPTIWTIPLGRPKTSLVIPTCQLLFGRNMIRKFPSNKTQITFPHAWVNSYP